MEDLDSKTGTLSAVEGFPPLVHLQALVVPLPPGLGDFRMLSMAPSVFSLRQRAISKVFYACIFYLCLSTLLPSSAAIPVAANLERNDHLYPAIFLHH